MTVKQKTGFELSQKNSSWGKDEWTITVTGPREQEQFLLGQWSHAGRSSPGQIFNVTWNERLPAVASRQKRWSWVLV